VSEAIDRTRPVGPPADLPRIGPSEPAGSRGRRREPPPREREGSRRPPAAPPADPTPDEDAEPGKGRTLDVRV